MKTPDDTHTIAHDFSLATGPTQTDHESSSPPVSPHPRGPHSIKPLIRIQHRMPVDTSTPSVILGLVPRICWPPLREMVQVANSARAASWVDPWLKAKDDGALGGLRMLHRTSHPHPAPHIRRHLHPIRHPRACPEDLLASPSRDGSGRKLCPSGVLGRSSGQARG